MTQEYENQTSQSEAAERAKENERETEEAHRLAAEQNQRDIEGGKKPIATTIAERIKGKLEKEEFSVFKDENGNIVQPPRGE